MKYLLAAIAALVGMYYAYPLIVGPSNVIEHVTAFTEDNAILLQVDFSVPLRYENHFPERQGEALQVKARLVTLGGVHKRESVGQGAVRPELASKIGLINVSYEGDAPGGPFVTFLFNRPVTYEVKPDQSFNSLIVSFPQPRAAKSASL